MIDKSNKCRYNEGMNETKPKYKEGILVHFFPYGNKNDEKKGTIIHVDTIIDKYFYTILCDNTTWDVSEKDIFVY